MLIFAANDTNDLYRVVAGSGRDCPRYDSPAEAVAAAPQGAGVLVLADDYPRPSQDVSRAVLDAARAKGLRLYVEYPASCAGLEFGAPQPTQWERVVVASDFFAPGLRKGTILALHGCWYLPVGAVREPPLRGGATHERAAHEPPLRVARVAGYHEAVFGVPADAAPILFGMDGADVMVATSALSRFVRGRYGPAYAWRVVWETLLKWLAPDETFDLAWAPSVGLRAGRDEALPAADELEREAFGRSVKWFREQIVFSIDWKKGACEGFESGIDPEGRQLRRTWSRGDCTGETAMVFAYDWAMRRNPASKLLAGQILDYVWSAPDFRQADPASPAYGLNNWYERGPVFYGDDNARVILPTLAAGQLLDDGRWDEYALRCILANLRTTGRLGFRRNRIDLHQFFEHENTWRFFRDEEVTSFQPHYQAYLWACFLWAFGLTGRDEFVQRTHDAIRSSMQKYPRWKWTNGFTQEMARMLLPLAFLVRVDDTPEHRGWIDRVAGDLLAQMQPSGAIHEKLGPLETGDYAPPQSNEAYGTNEASLIQRNGDPACDLLYTTNYAFLGLHEAAMATGAPHLKAAEDTLAEFLCRIQVRSTAQPYLDGAWMRSFDDELWEYWGSSADLGWGAWSVEAGWTNAWIASVLAMRRLNTSLFGLASSNRLQAIAPQLMQEMLEG